MGSLKTHSVYTHKSIDFLGFAIQRACHPSLPPPASGKEARRLAGRKNIRSQPRSSNKKPNYMVSFHVTQDSASLWRPAGKHDLPSSIRPRIGLDNYCVNKNN